MSIHGWELQKQTPTRGSLVPFPLWWPTREVSHWLCLTVHPQLPLAQTVPTARPCCLPHSGSVPRLLRAPSTSHLTRPGAEPLPKACRVPVICIVAPSSSPILESVLGRQWLPSDPGAPAGLGCLRRSCTMTHLLGFPLAEVTEARPPHQPPNK